MMRRIREWFWRRAWFLDPRHVVSNGTDVPLCVVVRVRKLSHYYVLEGVDYTWLCGFGNTTAADIATLESRLW